MMIFLHSQSAHPNRENQDAIKTRHLQNAHSIALADGAGGQAGGALAARLATQTALDFLERADDPFDSDTLRTAISLADEAVEAHQGAGFSTLIVLACDDARTLRAPRLALPWRFTSGRAAKPNSATNSVAARRWVQAVVLERLSLPMWEAANKRC